MPEGNRQVDDEQMAIENQKRMLLISVEEEKEKQNKMLAIESDVKNVERDMQDIQDLFRDLSKLVNVSLRIVLLLYCTLYCLFVKYKIKLKFFSNYAWVICFQNSILPLTMIILIRNVKNV